MNECRRARVCVGLCVNEWMNAGARVCIHLFKETQTNHVTHNTVHLLFNWAIWILKFMWTCICLIGDCKSAVKISTSQVQMLSWLLRGWEIALSLVYCTLRPNHTYGYLGYFRATLLDLSLAQGSFIRRYNRNAVVRPTKLLAFGASQVRFRLLI